MAWIFVLSASFAASLLTLFTGFGLGTLLLPVFALFFPLPLAISLTALVHLANNLFKFLLLGRHADRETVLRFGIPAMAASFVGAACLVYFEAMPPLFHYQWFGHQAEVTVLKCVIAGLMTCFAFYELIHYCPVIS